MLYVGVDEAGYGPRLGPLCVAATCFRLDVSREASARVVAPVLWELLKPAVGRSGASQRESGGGIIVGDSKRVLARGPHGLGEGLVRLGRALLAFSLAGGHEWRDDEEFLRVLGARSGPETWYGGAAIACGSYELGRCDANHLREACARAGVGMESIRARVLAEHEYNERCAATGNKARVSFSLVGELLRECWERLGPGDRGFFAVDRQGGRARYREVLEKELPGVEVRAVDESPASSVYELVDGTGRRATLMFEVGGEERHLPVALASMTAKYLRERMMQRFNRYWCARIPELKPTAGYEVDARRWLEDVRAHVSAEELRGLIRVL